MSVDLPGELPIVFDMGTGLRYFGRTQPSDGTFRGTCLLSHLHWDHTQGLPFFKPILADGSMLDVYAPVQEDGRSAADAIRMFMRPPHFPISLDDLPGKISFHDVGDTEFTVGGAHVVSRLVPHVGNTLGFRLTFDGTTIAYVSDHQQPYDGSHHLADGVRELAQGVDLLIHDSQYTKDEFVVKRNWGHCTVDYAVWVAAECGVRTLALFHHDPIRDDEWMDGLADCASALAKVHGNGLKVIPAREGMTVELPGR